MFDLQINGFASKDFYCNFWESPDRESIEALSRFQKESGVDAYLATLITSAPESLKKNLKTIYKYNNEQDNSGAVLKGVHIEGGLISRLGVHPQEYAQSISLPLVQDLVKTFPNLIKLWTLCPKLDKHGDITRFLQDSGIKVSYGHSQASYQEAMQAFDKFEVDLVTHWGNAMYVAKDFRQRECRDRDIELLDDLDIAKADPDDIGIGLAAYRHPKVKLMLIAGNKQNGDEHLDPRLLKKLATKKHKQFILVSDSVAYQGKIPPPQLVGGLSSLKQHCQNALATGIELEQIDYSTKVLTYEIFS